ncbi:MAG: chloride channel protein [Synechococcaceae cyanobacterium]|nr:chloride channel protein [Synechococcaceae cyanobacterium]
MSTQPSPGPLRSALAALLPWLPLGLALGLLEWPWQLLSELGFQLQRRLWPLPQLTSERLSPLLAPSVPAAALLVFSASAALFALAWGPLAAGRGGGIAPVLALDRVDPTPQPPALEPLLDRLSLRAQLCRLPLMLLTHLGGLAVGIESPAAALGAALLLALRQRWPRGPLQRLSQAEIAVIGAAAGLGTAFRSPLLAACYGLEELGRRSGVSLLLPALLLSGAGSLVSSSLGQPARLPGRTLGPLPPALWPWALLLTLVGAGLGALLVRQLIGLAQRLQGQLARRPRRVILLAAAALTLLALASGGLSLNDGSLSLAAALRGQTAGPPLTLLWRWGSTLLSIAMGAPGGLMHDAMTLGALLAQLPPGALTLEPGAMAQLAAVGATALFAAANGTPLFCAVFVTTLQGDVEALPLLLLVSAVSAALAERWRGEEWNSLQAAALLHR